MALGIIFAIAAAYVPFSAAQAAVVPSYGLFTDPVCYATNPAPLVYSPGFFNTLEGCLDYLARPAVNSHFGGMQNGDFCYGGNITRQPSTIVDISECNLPCINNASEVCGGTDRVLIYRSGPVIVPTTPPYGDSHWIGCSVNTGSGRSLIKETGSAFDNMLSCTSQCSRQGFKLAGIENGLQCYCGNSLLNNVVLLAEAGGPCNSGCEGDPYQECGGINALTVYQMGNDTIPRGPGQIVPSYNGWSLLDCYTDSVSSRSLPVTIPFPHEDTRIESCLDACNSQGYKLAGLEYGLECYCGNSIRDPGVVAPSGCDAMQCVGNADQLCGGPDRLLVYQHA